jgi:hypothetical protein
MVVEKVLMTVPMGGSARRDQQALKSVGCKQDFLHSDRKNISLRLILFVNAPDHFTMSQNASHKVEYLIKSAYFCSVINVVVMSFLAANTTIVTLSYTMSQNTVNSASINIS